MVPIVVSYLLVGVAIASGWHRVDLRLRPWRRVAVKYGATVMAWPLLAAVAIGVALLARRIDPHQRLRSASIDTSAVRADSAAPEPVDA